MKYLSLLFLIINLNSLSGQNNVHVKGDTTIFHENLTEYKAERSFKELLNNIVASDSFTYYNPNYFYFDIHFTADTNGVFVTIMPDRWNKSSVVTSFGLINISNTKFLMQMGKGNISSLKFLTPTKKKIAITRKSPKPYFYDAFDTELELLTRNPSLSGELKLSNGSKVYLTVLTKYSLNGYKKKK